MKVGTKQLKNELSRYLRRARAGEVVKVTDRGRVIAELRGVTAGESDEDEQLRDLEAAGLITCGSGRFRRFRALRPRGGVLASVMVSEGRD